jgi:hypothetical protein
VYLSFMVVACVLLKLKIGGVLLMCTSTDWR